MCDLGAFEQLAMEENRVRKILTHTHTCNHLVFSYHQYTLATINLTIIFAWPSFKDKKEVFAVAGKLLTSPTFMDF